MKNKSKFLKLQNRLERSIEKGSFFHFAKEKQKQLARRIHRYANSLKQAVKPAILSAFFVLGLNATAQAQLTFAEQTGANNPFDSIDVGLRATAAPVDIDNDGDMDFFSGTSLGAFVYYKNLGTASVPDFQLQTGANNPLDTFSVSAVSVPAFVDIDNDGDMDVFTGEYYGTLKYYQNTGTSSSPLFQEVTGSGNPLGAVDVGTFASPGFVDIDNDGDMDVFVGEYTGTILFFQNTGTASSPVYTAQTGAANPFDGVVTNATYGHAAATFTDIDNDGDMDAFIGDGAGLVHYFLNVGTAATPNFSEQTGTSNPFNGLLGSKICPAAADLDNDGKADMSVGQSDGTIKYYKNTTVVSVAEVEKDKDFLNIYVLGTSGTISLDRPVSGQATIFDMNGRLVANSRLNYLTVLDFSYLNNGIYLLKIEADGQEKTIKFILHK